MRSPIPTTSLALLLGLFVGCSGSGEDTTPPDASATEAPATQTQAPATQTAPAATATAPGATATEPGATATGPGATATQATPTPTVGEATPTATGAGPTASLPPGETPTEGGETPTAGATLDARLVAFPVMGAAPLTVSFAGRSDDSVTRWQWDFGDGETGEGAQPSHSYTSPGAYTVSLRVENDAAGLGETVWTGLITVIADEGEVPTAGDEDVVISELFSDGQERWAEVQNVSDHTVSFAGLWLSDDDETPSKFVLPAGAHVPAGGFYLIFESVSFGTGESAFSLSRDGGRFQLASVPEGPDETDILADEGYEPLWNGSSLGRYYTSDGDADFVTMTAATPGAANADPYLYDVVISELYYNPASDDDNHEYVEITNASDVAVALSSDAGPMALVDGVDYVFPPDTTLAAGEKVVVVKDSVAFAEAFPGATARVFGPFDGKLSNGGEGVQLGSLLSAGDEPLYWHQDRVSYGDEAPWPVSADGEGKALGRIDLKAFGNDVANWEAVDPSPGD